MRFSLIILAMVLCGNCTAQTAASEEEAFVEQSTEEENVAVVEKLMQDQQGLIAEEIALLQALQVGEDEPMTKEELLPEEMVLDGMTTTRGDIIIDHDVSEDDADEEEEIEMTEEAVAEDMKGRVGHTSDGPASSAMTMEEANHEESAHHESHHQHKESEKQEAKAAKAAAHHQAHNPEATAATEEHETATTAHSQGDKDAKATKTHKAHKDPAPKAHKEPSSAKAHKASKAKASKAMYVLAHREGSLSMHHHHVHVVKAHKHHESMTPEEEAREIDKIIHQNEEEPRNEGQQQERSGGDDMAGAGAEPTPYDNGTTPNHASVEASAEILNGDIVATKHVKASAEFLNGDVLAGTHEHSHSSGGHGHGVVRTPDVGPRSGHHQTRDKFAQEVMGVLLESHGAEEDGDAKLVGARSGGANKSMGAAMVGGFCLFATLLIAMAA